MNEFQDRQAISELMHHWCFWRDQARWDELRTAFHPEGTINVTWFTGLFSDFVAASIEMRKRRSGSKHWLGGSLIRLEGNRALSETNVMIMGRSVVHDIEVDTVAYGRFFDFVERRDGVWRILRREAIYEKDRVDPVVAGTVVPFDAKKLAGFPPPYRHLAYSLSSQGFTVSPDLPTNDSASLAKVHAQGEAWITGKSAAWG
ncbi:MAG: nuclear transport factor 2 family protein [Betaproteobacteria bacterium]